MKTEITNAKVEKQAAVRRSLLLKRMEKGFRFIVNPAESQRIQKYCFSKGINWDYGNTEIKHLQFTSLFIWRGRIFYTNTPFDFVKYKDTSLKNFKIYIRECEKLNVR